MSVSRKLLNGDVIEVAKTHFSADNGDVGVVYLNGVEIDHVMVANTHFGYVIKAVYPYELTEDGLDIKTERLDGAVRVACPPRRR